MIQSIAAGCIYLCAVNEDVLSAAYWGHVLLFTSAGREGRQGRIASARRSPHDPHLAARLGTRLPENAAKWVCIDGG